MNTNAAPPIRNQRLKEAIDKAFSSSVIKPSPLFGENGDYHAQPKLDRLQIDDAVPMRVPVYYTYPEAFGNAQVSYCFPVGKFVRLASGGACRIEQVRTGTRFKLEGGGVATVTKIDPLMPWPEENPARDANGNVLRRVVGTVKHTGAIILDVTVGANTLTTTPEHLFWSVTRQAWVPAKKLKRGELLKGANGQSFPVGGIGAPRKALVDLHNIEVEISHTYYVGNPPILVHNGYNCIQLPEWEQELVDADGLSVRAPNQIGAAESQLHHIATIYEGEGNWASRFSDLFDRAGFDLEDDINKVMVDGHFGPHDELYHELVFDVLDNATSGLEGEAFRNAFVDAMQNLRSRVTDINDILNALITR